MERVARARDISSGRGAAQLGVDKEQQRVHGGPALGDGRGLQRGRERPERGAALHGREPRRRALQRALRERREPRAQRLRRAHERLRVLGPRAPVLQRRRHARVRRPDALHLLSRFHLFQCQLIWSPCC